MLAVIKRPYIGGECGEHLRQVSYLLSPVTTPWYWAGVRRCWQAVGSTMMSRSSEGGAARWSFDSDLVCFEKVREKNLRPYGTIARYRTVMSDGIEREVIHGRALDAIKPAGRSANLTIGTAPPLSLGPEGMTMHFLLKSMEMGVDGVVFGPELSRSDQRLDEDARRRIASQVSLPNSAYACHQVADRLAAEAGADLGHMLWAGISLGAMKGILFAAMAPPHRTMVYSHFVAPVCPNPITSGSEQDLGKFLLGELAALFRGSAELIWKDVRDRTFRVHENVARVVRPGLLLRYLRSVRPDSAFRVFTHEWGRAAATGAAGTGATWLPMERLATFELFDTDLFAPVDEWEQKLRRQIDTGTTRIVVHHGRHLDATRLSFQKRRAATLKSVIGEIYRGTPVDELAHPLAATEGDGPQVGEQGVEGVGPPPALG